MNDERSGWAIPLEIPLAWSWSMGLVVPARCLTGQRVILRGTLRSNQLILILRREQLILRSNNSIPQNKHAPLRIEHLQTPNTSKQPLNTWKQIRNTPKKPLYIQKQTRNTSKQTLDTSSRAFNTSKQRLNPSRQTSNTPKQTINTSKQTRRSLSNTPKQSLTTSKQIFNTSKHRFNTSKQTLKTPKQAMNTSKKIFHTWSKQSTLRSTQSRSRNSKQTCITSNRT